MSNETGTIEYCINYARRHGCTITSEATAELAQLHAAADELQRIRELIDPLDGQSIYDSIDALLHDESSAEIYKIDMAEQARQLDEARELLTSLNWVNRVDAWIAANPAPLANPQQCTCGTGNATMPEYHAADCALRAESQP